MKLRVLKRADRDLDRIYAHIGADNLLAAAEQVERVLDVIQHLKAHPEMGRVGRVRGTRELAIDGTPYIVAYRIKGNVVEVLRVIHGAQRWPRRL